MFETAAGSVPPMAGEDWPKRQAEEPLIDVPGCIKCAKEALMNPKLLGCHFGSGNAIGYLLKRDVTSVVR